MKIKNVEMIRMDKMWRKEEENRIDEERKGR